MTAAAGALLSLLAVEAAHALEPVAPFLLRLVGCFGLAGAALVALDNPLWADDLKEALETEFRIGALGQWTQRRRTRGSKAPRRTDVPK